MKSFEHLPPRVDEVQSESGACSCDVVELRGTPAVIASTTGVTGGTYSLHNTYLVPQWRDWGAARVSRVGCGILN